MIEGWAAIFNVVDLHGDCIMPGAFRLSIMRKSEYPMLLEHKQCIGRWSRVIETPKGLYVIGFVNKDLMPLQRGLSIGYVPRKYINKNGVRYISAIDLYEISIVKNPANRFATLLDVS